MPRRYAINSGSMRAQAPDVCFVGASLLANGRCGSNLAAFASQFAPTDESLIFHGVNTTDEDDDDSIVCLAGAD